MNFCKERGIGYCGLACVVCGYADCPGCVDKIVAGNDCAIGKCAVQKGVDGCYDCPDYPCDKDMLKNKRIRAFNRFMQDFSKDALIERLYVNAQSGIEYHKPNDVVGDYDVLKTEDEVYNLLTTPHPSSTVESR